MATLILTDLRKKKADDHFSWLEKPSLWVLICRLMSDHFVCKFLFIKVHLRGHNYDLQL